MKLLAKTEAQSKVKRDNDQLIAENLRLRQFWKDITQKLNTVKESYEPDKLAKLKEFEQFAMDLMVRKAKLLEELQGIENEIIRKKDIYFGLIAKQDALDEKIYQMTEAQKKLDLRERFVVDLEQKWRAKQ